MTMAANLIAIVAAQVGSRIRQDFPTIVYEIQTVATRKTPSKMTRTGTLLNFPTLQTYVDLDIQKIA